MLRNMTAAHHIPATSCLLANMLILVALTMVEAGTRSAVRIASTVSRASGKRIHIVCLAIFLNLSKYTKSTLRWNEARNNFLCNIFSRSSQQVLELD